MNTEAETAAPMDTTQVWAEETQVLAPRKKLPGIKMLVILATLVMLLAAGGSVWAYITGLQELHALVAQSGAAAGNSQQTISRMVEQANHWALQLAMAAVAGGAGLFAVAVLGGFWLKRSWTNRHFQATEEADLRAQRLLGQLADAKVSEEEARNAQVDAETRLFNVSQRHAGLEREVEQRRQAEKIAGGTDASARSFQGCAGTTCAGAHARVTKIATPQRTDPEFGGGGNLRF